MGDVMAVPGEFAGSRRRRGVTRLLEALHLRLAFPAPAEERDTKGRAGVCYRLNCVSPPPPNSDVKVLTSQDLRM